MEYIYVLDKDGTPLMPTTRHRMVQKLLKKGMASVVEHVPMVIRLKYDTPGKTQPLYGGTDPGRTNIGNAVVTADGTVVYKDHVETRNADVPGLMQERKAHRQQSRRGERQARKRLARAQGTTRDFPQGRTVAGCGEPMMLKDIINTEAKFGHRARPEGWLTPTAEHLVRTHVNMATRIRKILPVTHWTLEANRFAFMLMEDGAMRGVDFQNGRLKDFRDVDEYVFCRQRGRCACCCGMIEHFHHIVPRSKGGSDRPENIAGLCGKCHSEVHTGARSLADIGERKKYGALSVLNQAVPFIMGWLEDMFGEHAMACEGTDTYALRELCGMEKGHDADAACIALFGSPADAVRDGCHTYEVRQFRRHDRARVRSQRERTYYLDGRAVAKNRRPRFEQQGKALSDLGLTRQEASRLVVKKSRRYYNDRERLMPGAEFFHDGGRYVMTGQLTGGKYYRAAGAGSRNFPADKCRVVRGNRGLVYIS